MDVKNIKRYPIGNPTRKWRQKDFIISTFNGICKDIEKGLTHLKEAHFNLVEMGWVQIDRVDGTIEAAEKVGIDILLQDWRYFGGFQDTVRNEIVEENIQQAVNRWKRSPNILGYYVWDEPYHLPDMEIAAEQTNIMEALDEDRLPFSVALPSYNEYYLYWDGGYDEYLKRYVEMINPPVFSLDYYPFRFYKPNDETQLDECPMLKDLFLLRKHSLEKNAPLWFYYQAVGNPDYDPISYEKMAVQAYLALLYGAKALQHFSAINAIFDDATGEKLPAFEDAKRLNGLVEPWGNTLMALTSTGIFHDDAALAGDPKKANYTEDFSQSKLFDGKLPPRISVGELVDGEGNRYALLLNRDYLANRTCQLSLKTASNVYEVSAVDGKQVLIERGVNEINLDLAPSQCLFLRLQPASETPYLIEYQLAK